MVLKYAKTWLVWVFLLGGALAQNGQWSEPVPVVELNGTNHDSYPSISSDGQTMYLTKGNYIWNSRWCGETWGTPTILNEHINSGQRQVKATVTPDNRTLYFTSWRAGGYGTYDIWKSEWDDGTNDWGEAEVLPPPINTEDMEWDVQLSYDGTKMYISSDRFFSWGDFDIWCSDWDSLTQTWGAPVNLGATINTSIRDYGPYPSIDGDRIYFSSWSRHGLFPPEWQDPPEIFVAYNRNGVWDSLEILTEINSDSWEQSPALSWDGLSLYFASSRNSPDGIRDIYVSHLITDIQDFYWGDDKDSVIKFSLYPNPSNDAILFVFDPTLGTTSSSLKIYNLLGGLVYDFSLLGQNSLVWNCKDIRGQAVPSGYYLAVLRAGNKTYREKFIITK